LFSYPFKIEDFNKKAQKIRVGPCMRSLLSLLRIGLQAPHTREGCASSMRTLLSLLRIGKQLLFFEPSALSLIGKQLYEPSLVWYAINPTYAHLVIPSAHR